MKSSPGRKLAAMVAVVVVGLAVAAARLDVPKVTGAVKGDEATYVAMALSAAKDFDLTYRAEDYSRFLATYGTGPEGIFLKLVPGEEGFAYAKSFAYAVVAAPFVAVLGLGGLLLLNVLLLAVDVWCAALFARARTGRPVAGALIGIAFVAVSVVPVYGVSLTPEIFNVSLVLVGYFLWLYKEVAPDSTPRWLRAPSLDWVAAVLIAVATFSKITHAPLIAPIVLSIALRQQWARAFATAAVFAVAVGGLYGVNYLITGDLNYQGGAPGSRRTFYGHFPYDKDNTPFEAGDPKLTNEVNAENELSPSFIAATLPKNVLYFFVGRDAGLIPYFFPGALILALFLARVRRAAVWQVTTVLALTAAAGGLLLLGPAVWNGGGGPIGNRYFLSLYPAMLFLLPSEMGVSTAIAAWVISLVLIGPILAHPFAASSRPWLYPERWPLRLLPIEITLLNDLPVARNLDRWRVKVQDEPIVFLYYMDGRTYFQEKDGFWVAPGTAEIIVRTERPLTGLKLKVKSHVDNHIAMTIGGRSREMALAPDSEVRFQLSPAPGWYALQTYQVVWKITTENGFQPSLVDKSSTDARNLGVFISASYEVK